MRRRRTSTPTSSHRNYLKFGFVIITIFFGLLFLHQLRNSLFFSKRDRLNIIIYDRSPTFYSYGMVDKVHYRGVFDSEMTVLIPGGYGKYKIKSLGELARLEKNPKLVSKAFSSLTSTSIDYYFYPKSFKSVHAKFTLLTYASNANFLDRVFISLISFNKKTNDFSLINFNTFSYTKKNTIEEHFFKKYQGYFYQKNLREENKNIQIVYNNHSSISTISRILEGEGIRVVDLSYSENINKGCKIIRNKKSEYTEKYLNLHFNCIISTGDTGGQDMIVELGSEVEKEWE
ncbi:MAG TPA: hypothetical protein VK338_02585 [Candidatus Nitrosocosmicus sp.]|nr:hypothetical protein [Candidatus Nitrosocosmicus sp.]